MARIQKIALAARHEPSGLNDSFKGEGLPFAEYVRQSERMLQQVHTGKAEAVRIVAGNAPFELQPDKQAGQVRRGVLLVHGLSDSPYHMRHVGEIFRRSGFHVMAVLLPGHGTQPGDLLQVKWQEWARTVDYGVTQLAQRCDEAYLAGYSAGGALSLYQAGHDDRVRGLFLFAPALRITRRAAWAHWHRLYSWAWPRAAWVNILPDRDFYKYESFCKNAAAQMYALTQALPVNLPPVPLFAVASADDVTVEAMAVHELLANWPHAHKKLLWYAAQPAAQSGLEWVDSRLPEERILGGAHTAIMMPPTDGHYGRVGDYANCLHYFEQAGEHYEACIQATQPLWLGEVSVSNLRQGLLRRLTYNPHFAAMESAMQGFIRELP